jgi:hypothetical protein
MSLFVLYEVGCEFRSNESVALQASVIIYLSMAELLYSNGLMGVAKPVGSHA